MMPNSKAATLLRDAHNGLVSHIAINEFVLIAAPSVCVLQRMSIAFDMCNTYTSECTLFLLYTDSCCAQSERTLRGR